MPKADTYKTFIMSVPPEAPPMQERQPALVTLTGMRMGVVFPLQGRSILIGRDPSCDIVLEDEGISRKHACILQSGGEYQLEDLQSTNGTYVEGTRLRGRAALTHGARIRIGSVSLRYALEDREELAARQHMYDMSVRDGLTKLYNRRHFDERLESEFAFASRHRSPLAVLVCDIDHFKSINDRFGHAAGDDVLKEVARSLAERVRTEDLVARIGGEEFAVLARGIDAAGAKQFAERLRSIIAGVRVVHDGQLVPLTMSIGVAHNHAGTPSAKAEALLGAADGALYAAKNAGRNRVVIATSPGKYSQQGVAEPPPAPSRRERLSRAETGPMGPDEVRDLPPFPSTRTRS